MKKYRTLLESDSSRKVFASLLSIVIGLAVGALVAAIVGLTKDNICKGMFKSNYRISSVTVTIADSTGNTVQQATAFGHQGEMNRFLLSRLNDKTEAPVRRGSLDVKALTPGTYHCTHTCQIATGEILTVRDFTFTIS